MGKWKIAGHEGVTQRKIFSRESAFVSCGSRNRIHVGPKLGQYLRAIYSRFHGNWCNFLGMYSLIAKKAALANCLGVLKIFSKPLCQKGWCRGIPLYVNSLLSFLHDEGQLLDGKILFLTSGGPSSSIFSIYSTKMRGPSRDVLLFRLSGHMSRMFSSCTKNGICSSRRVFASLDSCVVNLALSSRSYLSAWPIMVS